MRIVIISDTHGSLENLRTVLAEAGPFDYLIHCGDVEGQEEEIRQMARCRCTFVRGNNDYASDLPDFDCVTLGELRLLVTHGHRAGIAYSVAKARQAAREAGCRAVLYGHTHLPLIDTSVPDTVVINPGSLTYPRQNGCKPSYAVMEDDRMGRWHYRLAYLDKPVRGFCF